LHDLAALVHELGEHYSRIQKRVSVHTVELAPFPFARMAVRRAIANLVDNALRYAGEAIELELGQANGTVFVEVRDRGAGIPATEVERLKRPFTRLDDSRSGAGGAGLGLAIVERVARAHGGALELLPRTGGGLVARLTLKT
jgi:two-component system osmolarity sensor histidine kinase EnvZ